MTKVIWILSLQVLAFFYGIAVHRFEIFPYASVESALLAATELKNWYELRDAEEIDRHPHIAASAHELDALRTRSAAAMAYEGYTLAETFSHGRFGLALVDMSGEVVHRWQLPESAYRAVGEANRLDVDPELHEIMGSHLYENGELLLLLSFRGLMKLDRCSKLLWFRSGRYHHSVAVGRDQQIWTLTQNWITDEAQAPARFQVPFYEDSVTLLSPEGEVLDNISVVDAILKSDYHGVIYSGDQDEPQVKNIDPTHANDVEILDEDFARHHAFAEPGDIMVSLRTLDTVIIIDRESKEVKWSLTGPFLRQHDPDAARDGTLSIFDNRTDRGQHNEMVELDAEQTFGYSRIIRMDPATQEILWSYEGTNDDPFYTSIQGDHQILPNGNVLIVETEAGRIFEIEPERKELVWEWFNRIGDPDRSDLVGRITRATRYAKDYPRFLGQGC